MAFRARKVLGTFEKRAPGRLLRLKRHITIELCVTLSTLRLLLVRHNVRSVLSLAWHERFSEKEWKIYCWEQALSLEPKTWQFHLVYWQATSHNCTKKRAARAALFFYHSTNQIIDLWRCRCRCRRHFVDSLLGTLRNDDSNEDLIPLHIEWGKKQWFLHVLHVLHAPHVFFFYFDTFVWRPLWNKDLKWPNLESCEGPLHTTLNGEITFFSEFLIRSYQLNA